MSQFHALLRSSAPTRRLALVAFLASSRAFAQLDAPPAEVPPRLLPPGYSSLEPALEEMRILVELGGWGTVPAEPEDTLEPGMSDARMPALRLRLVASGHLAPDQVAEGELYDPELVAAVTRFQDDLGLQADGRLGKRTVAALNVPAEKRLVQIEASLERQKQWPGETGRRYIVVNVPEAMVRYVEDGQAVLVLKAIVGKKASPTPTLSETIRALIFNPNWDVPPSIARKEELPKIRTDPAYLAAERMQVLEGGPGGVEVDPATIDWTRDDALRGRSLRQLPGSKNPLGKVKLAFPNPHMVYLHDTPGKSSFLRASRALSHGCVRVERALDLAERLLAPNRGWDRARMDRTTETSEPLTVALSEPVPIHIVYWTAWRDETGRLRLREDLYELDGLEPLQ